MMKEKKHKLGMTGSGMMLRYIIEQPLSPTEAERFLSAVENALGNIELVYEYCAGPGAGEYRRLDGRKQWLSYPGRLNKSWGLHSGVRELSKTDKTHVFAGMHDVPVGAIVECDLTPYTAFIGILTPAFGQDVLDSLLAAVGDVLQASSCIFDSPYTRTMLEFGRREKLGKVAPTVYKMLKEYPFLKAIPKSKQWTGMPTHEQLVEVSKIGWINYWSDESANIAGLDEAVCAKSSFAKCVKTRHGWYFRLTDEPLDFDNPKHVDLYLATFDLLPNVGIRSKS